MHVDKQELEGIRKLFQDLIAPELTSVKAILSAMGEEARAAEARSEQNFKAAETRTDKNFALIREGSKAAETRSEKNFAAVHEEFRQVRTEIQLTRADLMDRIERSRREILLAIENQALRQENEQLRSAAKRDQPSA